MEHAQSAVFGHATDLGGIEAPLCEDLLHLSLASGTDDE
jgi:hypothetical protein